MRELVETYPHIVAITLESRERNLSTVGAACDEQFEFEFTLDVLLDAFEKLHDSGWQSGERDS